MGKRCLSGMLVAASLGFLTAARAQDLAVPPGPGAVPGPAGLPGPAACPPGIPPGCSVALHEPPKDRPNAFCGEQEGGAPNCLVFDAEYLLWTVKRGPVNTPLVTTSTAPSDVLAGDFSNIGALGQPNTRVLFGGGDINFKTLSGARFEAFWTPQESIFFVEAQVFFLERGSSTFTAQSDPFGNPLIARPIFSVLTDQQFEDARLVSFPGITAGGVSVWSSSRLWGWEAGLGKNCCCTDSGLVVDCWLGFRFLELREDLRIIDSETAIDPTFGVTFGGDIFGGGDTTSAMDYFKTRNRFYGAQVGTRARYCWGPLTARLDAKVALGDANEHFEITGESALRSPNVTLITPGSTGTLPGGLLALPSNSGVFSHNTFAVVPEVGLTLGCQLNSIVDVFVGYDFLYWSDVARPGDQIDRRIDLRQVPTAAPLGQFDQSVNTLPTRLIKQTDFWAQGAHFGFGLRY